MLVRYLDVDLLSVALPSQSSLWSSIADTNSTMRDPFLNNRSDELNLPPEVIRVRNALEHRINIGLFVAGTWFDCTTWFRHEIQKCLQWIRKMLTIIQSRGGYGTCLCKLSSCFDWQMVEVAPCAITRENDFGMVRKVELIVSAPKRGWETFKYTPENAHQRNTNNQHRPIVGRK